MEKSCGRAFLLLVTLALFLEGFVAVAASAELPLLPPLDHFQASAIGSSASQTQEAECSRIVSRLIRTHFRGQVRWRPFLQHHEQSRHHRVVREYRPRPGVGSTQTMSENVVDCDKLGHDLAALQFHLRGNPSPSPVVPHFQTVVEVSSHQQVSVELASL